MRLLKTVGQELYDPDTKNVIPAKAGIQKDLSTVIRGGGLTFICCLLCCIAFSMPPVMAEDTSTVPYKDWWEYTDEEKDFLKHRWTSAEIKAVVTALKEDKTLPDFVDWLTDTLSTREQRTIFRLLMTFEVRSHRADLRRISLNGSSLAEVDLSLKCMQGTDLSLADLEAADLRGANLQGARLISTHLYEADLRSAYVQRANLYKANLQGADLDYAEMQRSDLRYCNMQGAYLWQASLQDADLLGARFDTTYLWSVDLGKAKNIRYIVWGDSLKPRYFIGEEKLADSTKEEEAFRDAEITYRDLKSFYEKELMYDIAAEFHFRENEVKTRRYFYQNPFIWFSRTVFLRLTYGYGSRPWRLMWYSLGVIGLFTVVFYVLALFPRTRVGIYITKQGDTRKKRLTGRHPHECLYFSLLAFATFGYGAIRPRQWLQLFRLKLVEHEPVGWVRIFVGLEAALGIWVLALLVTVLFGR